MHLSLVEATLRLRNTDGLTVAQKQNRLQCLGYVHQYWQTGNFPQNEDYTYCTPIFIDKHDNFCAVGYLVKASGHEDVSRMIAAQTNLAYVQEMKYPQLLAWAKEYGFTVDELAWIQPSYIPHAHLATVGKGTDGAVKELFVDSTAQRLYVGGIFTNVDSTITANNIAYVTDSNGTYTWHNMGAGINGPVYAIVTYNNKVFAGGQFTTAGGTAVNNIAYWDGTAWQNAGCISGMAKDLIVFNDTLYATALFGNCISIIPQSLLKWTGSIWQGIYGIGGLGIINTMEVRDTFLYLGGTFYYYNNNDTVHTLKWNPNTGFQTFANDIPNDVNDFEVYKDTVYAVCKNTGSSTIFYKLSGDTWSPVGTFPYGSNGTLSFNAACALADTFIVGGDFYKPGGIGYPVSNSMNAGDNFLFKNYYFLTDGAVNKMTVFKNSIFVGGDFHTYYGNNNGIGYMSPGMGYLPVSAEDALTKACSMPATASVSPIFGIPPYKYRFWNRTGKGAGCRL